MKKEEYIETIVVNKKMVNVGMDDYGQCYFLEWVDDEGNLQETGCGTYNLNYYEVALSMFDYKGYYITVYGQDAWDELMELHKKRGLPSIDTDDYQLYNIDEFYKERGL